MKEISKSGTKNKSYLIITCLPYFRSSIGLRKLDDIVIWIYKERITATRVLYNNNMFLISDIICSNMHYHITILAFLFLIFWVREEIVAPLKAWTITPSLYFMMESPIIVTANRSTHSLRNNKLVFFWVINKLFIYFTLPSPSTWISSPWTFDLKAKVAPPLLKLCEE